jgi:pimeloyl-ACP methyl ester carboxylesterase
VFFFRKEEVKFKHWTQPNQMCFVLSVLIFACAQQAEIQRLPAELTPTTTCDDPLTQVLSATKVREELLSPQTVQNWAKRLQGDETPARMKPFILSHGKKTSKAILLVHAMGMSPAQTREYAQAYFEKGFNVVSILLPGCGVNRKFFVDKLSQPESLLNEWEQEILFGLSVARELGHKVAINGFSIGAATTLYTAFRNPNLFDEIILTSPSLKSHRVADRLLNGALNEFDKWSAANPDADIIKNPFISTPGWQDQPEFSDIGYKTPMILTYKYSKYVHQELLKVRVSKKLNAPIFVSWTEAEKIADPEAIRLFAKEQSAVEFELPLSLSVSHDDTLSGTKAQSLIQAQADWIAR